MVPLAGMWLSLKGCEKAIALTGERCCLHSGSTVQIQRRIAQLMNCWSEPDQYAGLCESCVAQSKAHFDEITVVRSEEESAQVSAAEGGAASTAFSAPL